MRGGTLYDGLRQAASHNGAWKTFGPQQDQEQPVMESSAHSQMDVGGIGAAWTTSRSSRTYTGGRITPQVYTTPRAAPANVADIQADAGMIMNARAALPNRGVTPRSPLMRGR
jgi:hypothetical protein